MALNKLIRFDWFIKKMLRNKSDFKVLEGFLSALLKKDIVILNILESEGNQEYENNKYNRVDILVEDEFKEKIIIEIQNERESDYLERILFGTSKVITDYMKLGQAYAEITKVISVSILYFNLGMGDDYIYYGTTEFYGMHTKDKLVVKNKVENMDEEGNVYITYPIKDNIFPEYYLINVEKFTNTVEEDIDEWIYMLKNSKIKKEFKSKYIKEAEECLDIAHLDETAIKAYERYLSNVAIERDIMQTAKEEGRQEGAEEKTVEVIKNMLAAQIPAQQIAMLVGVSVQSVLAVQNSQS